MLHKDVDDWCRHCERGLSLGVELENLVTHGLYPVERELGYRSGG